jgi:hypothetical protein
VSDLLARGKKFEENALVAQFSLPSLRWEHSQRLQFPDAGIIVVYLLQNKAHQWYVGFTDNMARRLAVHNAGGCLSTRHSCDWVLRAYVHGFEGSTKAQCIIPDADLSGNCSMVVGIAVALVSGTNCFAGVPAYQTQIEGMASPSWWWKRSHGVQLPHAC